MPWSGGVYTRGYPSWTNDANSNLPISATKFDTEDNDFAAGLNNCLTIDGLNKPTASLNWTQQINLSRATDGQLASWARTAGSGNPALVLSVVDSLAVVKFTMTGTLLVVPGASAIPVEINGPSGNYTLLLVGATSDAVRLGLEDGNTGNQQFQLRVGGAATGIFDIFDQAHSKSLFQINPSTSALTGLGPVAAAQVDMTPDTGTFTPALTGFSGSPTASGAWYRIGKLMLLQMVISGTSNGTGFSVTNLPSACQPPAQGVALTTFGATDNGNSALLAEVLIAAASGTVTFQLAKTNTVTNEVQGVAASWTGSGTKGISFSVAYLLN